MQSGDAMPPTVTDIILRQLEEMRCDIKAIRDNINGYSPQRCEAHTERLHAIGSRQDTLQAATEALATDRRARWARIAALIGLAGTVGALASLGLKMAGL